MDFQRRIPSTGNRYYYPLHPSHPNEAILYNRPFTCRHLEALHVDPATVSSPKPKTLIDSIINLTAPKPEEKRWCPGTSVSYLIAYFESQPAKQPLVM